MAWRRRSSSVRYEAREPVRDDDGRLDVQATLAGYGSDLDRLTRRQRRLLLRPMRPRERDLLARHHADHLAAVRAVLEDARLREDED